MALNDFFEAHAKDVPPDGEFIVDGSTAETGGAEIHEVFASGGMNLYKEVDTDGNGTYEISVQIDSRSSGFHSQTNQVEVSDSGGVRLRLVNVGEAPADYVVNGIEVNS